MELTKESLFEKDLEGKVIIFKTDTVYGIGALLNDEAAIERIYEIKKRDKTNPLAVLVDNEETARRLVKNPDKVMPYVKAYWPGALTLVTKKSDAVSDSVTRGKDTVGIRMPSDPDALAILSHFGPMAVTSLNLSSEPPVLKYLDALEFENSVDFIVKGDDLDSLASTVYDVDRNVVLRQGSITVKPTEL
ncbi:MAG: L-threonylcarbamoyladenylate synthase [Bacillota bacterium]